MPWKAAIAWFRGSDARSRSELATRLQAVVASSDRLRASDPLNQAIAAFQGTVPPPPAVTAYNRTVRDYEDERNGLLRSPVASLFGYDSRPQLVLAG